MTTTIFAHLPLIVLPDFVTWLPTSTPMYEGTLLGGTELLPELVVKLGPQTLAGRLKMLLRAPETSTTWSKRDGSIWSTTRTPACAHARTLMMRRPGRLTRLRSDAPHGNFRDRQPLHLVNLGDAVAE